MTILNKTGKEEVIIKICDDLIDLEFHLLKTIKINSPSVKIENLKVFSDIFWGK